MVVHMRGFAANLPSLMAFAGEVGVPVFEDAVPALGAELNGRKLGTSGWRPASAPSRTSR